MNEKDEINLLLDAAIRRAERRGNRYSGATWLCYGVAYSAGLAAALISIGHFADGRAWIPAVLAILPSFALAALTTFNFPAWAQWELDRAFIVRTVRRRTPLATDEELGALVAEWNARDAELRLHKPWFGAFPGARDRNEPKGSKSSHERSGRKTGCSGFPHAPVEVSGLRKVNQVDDKKDN